MTVKYELPDDLKLYSVCEGVVRYDWAPYKNCEADVYWNPILNQAYFHEGNMKLYLPKFITEDCCQNRSKH